MADIAILKVYEGPKVLEFQEKNTVVASIFYNQKHLWTNSLVFILSPFSLRSVKLSFFIEVYASLICSIYTLKTVK